MRRTSAILYERSEVEKVHTSIGLKIDALVATRWPTSQCRRYCYQIDRACSGYTVKENTIRRRVYWEIKKNWNQKWEHKDFTR